MQPLQMQTSLKCNPLGEEAKMCRLASLWHFLFLPTKNKQKGAKELTLQSPECYITLTTSIHLIFLFGEIMHM